MKKISALFFLCLMLQSIALVQAETEEPDFVSCRACKTVQTFSIAFGIYFGLVLTIHCWRWVLAEGNAHRRMELRGYIITSLKIIGGVFLIVYVLGWLLGYFSGSVILSPHDTMRGCEAVCLV